MLKKLLDQHRGKYGGYDVIVPSSGGKIVVLQLIF